MTIIYNNSNKNNNNNYQCSPITSYCAKHVLCKLILFFTIRLHCHVGSE